MKGWLVNDTLTCIPGTRTLWHELLDWFPLLQDKTNGHTPFNLLTKKIEREASLEPPDYIIRNGTFFPKIKVPVKTISLIQDIYHNEIRTNQIDVINNSNLVVFNSNYTKTHYQNDIKVPSVIIPLILFSSSLRATQHAPIPSPVSCEITSGKGIEGFKGFSFVIGTIKSEAVSVSCLPKEPAG